MGEIPLQHCHRKVWCAVESSKELQLEDQVKRCEVEIHRTRVPGLQIKLQISTTPVTVSFILYRPDLEDGSYSTIIWTKALTMVLWTVQSHLLEGSSDRPNYTRLGPHEGKNLAKHHHQR